jgi:hypothetical protein
MTTQDDQLTTPISASELPEIELEPTRILDYETDVYEPSQTSEPTSAAASFTKSREFQTLLRKRLLAITLISAIMGVVRFVFCLFVPNSGEGLAIGSMAARAIFATGLSWLLASRVALSYRALRIIEYVFFGVQALMVLGTQYYVGLELMERGDVPRVVAFDKNAVIRMIMLMVAYGFLIPNKPQRTLKVVLTMAVGPILVMVALVAAYAESPALATMPIGELAASNALFVVFGAAIAIVGSYLLNNLQSELHDARRLGQYQLGEKLGEGGMGEVYLAEHQLLKRPCALKLIKSGTEANPLALARFEREVKSAAALSHPNTIQIYDYGHTDDGTFYYVMEYLPGLSLSDLIRQFGPLSPGRAIFIITQVCKSLQEAHHLGMVHRDLKPANIFVSILGGKCDVAKVLDFGLVKVADSEDAPQLTAEYTVSGTPSFMSPEQASGMRDVDSRADLYALGAILYYVLTGSPPFEKPNPMALMIAHASEPVVPPSQRYPGVPEDLEAVVMKCLSKVPSERYPDAKSLAAALSSCKSASDWDELQAEEWWLNQAESLELEAEVIKASL